MEVRDEMYAPIVGFQSKKAAQASAYFAIKNSGGKVEKLKLIKLLYLAERLMLKRHGRPMFYDQYFSMKHGPILSNALNGINGLVDKKTWSRFISLSGNTVRPTHDQLGDNDLDRFSRSEKVILEEIWQAFGKMTAGEIRAYTHDRCPEYHEVSQGRLPISLIEVLKAVGSKSPNAAAEAVAVFRKTESIFQT